MPDLPGQLIRHRGFFNYEAIIKAINEWYLYEDINFNISAYKYKIPSPMGMDKEVKFKGDKKLSEYVKMGMDVRLQVFGMRDVELIQEGQKSVVQEGQLRITISPKIDFDWQGRYQGNKFYKWLGDIMQKKILKYKIGDYWEDMVLLKAMELAKTIRTTIGQEVV